MILKGPISFNRKKLPPYIFKFNVAFISFAIAWFVLCFPPIVAVGQIFGESIKTYAVMCALFGVFILGVTIFYIIGLKLRARLVDECAAALEEEFVDMPLEQAESILKEKGVINEYGFIACEGDVFDIPTIPFDKAEFGFYAHSEGTRVECRVDIYYDDENYGATGIAVMDAVLYNFLQKRGFNLDLESSEEFALLQSDKKNFCRKAFGFKLK